MKIFGINFGRDARDTDKTSLEWNAFVYALTNTFTRGFIIFAQWIAAGATLIIATMLFFYALEQLEISQQANGTTSVTPFYIISLIWLYLVLIPVLYSIFLSYYNKRSIQPKSFLSFLHPRALGSFAVVSLIPIAYIEAMRYCFNQTLYLTPHYIFRAQYELVEILFPLQSAFTWERELGEYLFFLPSIFGVVLIASIMFAGYYILDKNYGPLRALKASWLIMRDNPYNILGLASIMLAIFVLVKHPSGLLMHEVFLTVRWVLIGLMSVYAYKELGKNY